MSSFWKKLPPGWRLYDDEEWKPDESDGDGGGDGGGDNSGGDGGGGDNSGGDSGGGGGDNSGDGGGGGGDFSGGSGDGGGGGDFGSGDSSGGGGGDSGGGSNDFGGSSQNSFESDGDAGDNNAPMRHFQAEQARQEADRERQRLQDEIDKQRRDEEERQRQAKEAADAEAERQRQLALSAQQQQQNQGVVDQPIQPGLGYNPFSPEQVGAFTNTFRGLANAIAQPQPTDGPAYNPLSPEQVGAVTSTFQQESNALIHPVVEQAAHNAAIGVAVAGGTPEQVAAAAETAARIASDRQSLDQQSAWTRAAFRSTYGANADQEWVRQHEAELNRNQQVYGSREPTAGTLPVSGAPAGTPVAPDRRIGVVPPPTSQPQVASVSAQTAATPTAAPIASATTTPTVALNPQGSLIPGPGTPSAPPAPGTQVTTIVPGSDPAHPTATIAPATGSAPTSLRPTTPTAGGLSAGDIAEMYPQTPRSTPQTPQAPLERPDDILTIQDVDGNTNRITRQQWEQGSEDARGAYRVINAEASPARTPVSRAPTSLPAASPPPAQPARVEPPTPLTAGQIYRGPDVPLDTNQGAGVNPALLDASSAGPLRTMGYTETTTPSPTQTTAQHIYAAPDVPLTYPTPQASPYGAGVDSPPAGGYGQITPASPPPASPYGPGTDSPPAGGYGQYAPPPPTLQSAVQTQAPLDTLATLALQGSGAPPSPEAIRTNAYNIAQGIAGMMQGKPDVTWPEPYLNDVARLAWAREESQNGRQSDPRLAPVDYIEHWKDAFYGSDDRVPLVKELNQQMIDYGADRSKPGGPFNWKEIYGANGDKGLISSQVFSMDCGTNAFSTILRSQGYNASPTDTFTYVRKFGNQYHNGEYFMGPAAMVNLVDSKAGLDAQQVTLNDKGWAAVDSELDAGRPVMLSGPGHWWAVSAKSPDGMYYAGPTALGAGKGGWLSRGGFLFNGAATDAVLVHGTMKPDAPVVQGMGLKSPGGSARDTRQFLSPSTQMMNAPAQPRAETRVSGTENTSINLTPELATKSRYTGDEAVQMRQRIMQEMPDIQFNPNDGVEERMAKMAPALQWLKNNYGVDDAALAGMAYNENHLGMANSGAVRGNNLWSVQYVPQDPLASGPIPEGRWAQYPSVKAALARFVSMYAHPDNGYKNTWANRGSTEGFLEGLHQDKYVVDEPGFPVSAWKTGVKRGVDLYNQVKAGTVTTRENPSIGRGI